MSTTYSVKIIKCFGCGTSTLRSGEFSCIRCRYSYFDKWPNTYDAMGFCDGLYVGMEAKEILITSGE